MHIDGADADLWLVLDEWFPLSLPRIFLRQPYLFGVIPHVDHRGFVCFAQEEGLFADQDRPLDILKEGFARAVEVLRRGRLGENVHEFADEFEAYWAQIASPVPLRAYSYFSPPGLAREISLVTQKVNDQMQLHFVTHVDDLARFWNGQLPRRLTLHKAIFLPLERGAIIVPPRHDGPFWSAGEVREAIVPNLSKSNRKLFTRFTRKTHAIKELVVVALPHTDGGNSLFGLQFSGIGSSHPLLSGGTAQDVRPVVIERRDEEYLVVRGGGSRHLAGARVLIVGCGAVGGHLAFELARAGVQRITAVDPDTLNPENTFRHVLGRNHWHQCKVDALKTEVERHFPYVVLEPLARSIQAAVADGSVTFDRFDAIAVATGKPAIDLSINRQIHTSGYSGICIFTWLEPLGIGGHAIRVLANSGTGCLECLYSSPHDTGSAPGFRGAFAAPGQSFGRALSGCATLFTPFGSVDAVQTAALALRLVVEGLKSPAVNSEFSSWKGSPKHFVDAGYQLSPRFSALADKPHSGRQGFRNPECTVCRSRVGASHQ